MNEARAFPLRTLLTVTTGRLLTRPTKDGNGIGDLYEILGWMTDDSPFTHQLGRFSKECKPWLLRWFPELNGVDDHLAALDQSLSADMSERREVIEAIVHAWLKNVSGACGLKQSYDVPRIPKDDHEHKNPIDELVAMRGSDEGIIVAGLEDE